MRKRSFRYWTAFAVLLCILSCGRIAPAMASQEAASAAAGLSAGEDFYDAGKKSLSVNFSAPAGVESVLIAAAYDKDGRMLEKVVKNDEKTGTVSFTFSDPGRFFRVFAINRESLAPLARSLSLTRDVTSDDITTEEFTLDMPGFQDKTAQALAAVIACGINAQKKTEALRTLVTDTQTVSYNATKWIVVTGYDTVSVSFDGIGGGVSFNTISYNVVDEEYARNHPEEDCREVIDEERVLYKGVSKFESVHNDDGAYADATVLIKEAWDAYDLYLTAAAVLDRLAEAEKAGSYYPPETQERRAEKLSGAYEVTDGAEALKDLARHAGCDAAAGKESLDRIRSYLDQAYALGYTDMDEVRSLLTPDSSKNMIRTAGGAGLLENTGFLLKDALLALDISNGRTLVIFAPDNKDIDENQDPSTDMLTGTLMYYGKNMLSCIGKLCTDPGDAFDRYEFEKNGDNTSATVTELCTDEDEPKLLRDAAMTLFSSDFSTGGTLSENMADFSAGVSPSYDMLQGLIEDGAYIGDIHDTYESRINGRIAESRGYRVVENISVGSSTRYSVNDEGERVGLYAEFSGDTMVCECMYSEDKTEGYNGVLYSRKWSKASGQEKKRLTEEIFYAQSPVGEPPSGAENAGAGTEEAAGGISIKNCVKKVITYYTEDGAGQTLNEVAGQCIKDVTISRFEPDRYDYFVNELEIDPFDKYNGAYERQCWFELMKKEYYYSTAPDGKLCREMKVVDTVEGPGLSITEWTEDELKRGNSVYGWDSDEGLYGFGDFMISDVLYVETYYTEYISGYPSSFNAQIRGHLNYRRNYDYSWEIYEAGSWCSTWSEVVDDKTITHTIQLPEDKDKVIWHHGYVYSEDNVYGWRHASGNGGGGNYTYIPVTY